MVSNQYHPLWSILSIFHCQVFQSLKLCSNNVILSPTNNPDNLCCVDFFEVLWFCSYPCCLVAIAISADPPYIVSASFDISFQFSLFSFRASVTVYNNPPTLCSRQTSRLTPSFISEAIDRPISPPSTATKFSTMCNRINQYKFSPAREVHAAPY